ncbi:MAG: beta-mannanase [Phycisphaera sp.]|nr:beta-mannanase [Phycisphaera sp.]
MNQTHTARRAGLHVVMLMLTAMPLSACAREEPAAKPAANAVATKTQSTNPDAATPAPAEPQPAPPAIVDPVIGTYHWPNGTKGVDAFGQWLGRDTVWGLDFIGAETWDSVGWPTWWLDAWSKWVEAKPGRRLIFSIPILAGPVDGSGPTQGAKGVGVPVSLERGAAGEYDQHIRDLANNLVKYGLGDTILRPGWEFNGDWYAWRAKGRTDAFIAYWRRIVTTMRSVPGGDALKFCWNPTLGDQQFSADEAWPGDEYVDYVGVDVYDETWIDGAYPLPADASAEEIERRRLKAWNDWHYGSKRGLAFWSQFAKDHGKPLAIPEWGVVRANHQHCGLDNPLFIERMHAFITDPANNVAFHCYFDVNTDDLRHQLSPGIPDSGHREGTEFPNAAKRFRELFGTEK